MAKQIQLRRGTTAENNGFTGAVGEVSVDTDKDVLVVHDGVTVGGFPVAARANADGTISLIKKDGTVVTTIPATGLFNNTLTSTATDQALTAAQGKALKDLADTKLNSASVVATGGAPYYVCRAWVNFNGTGTVAIRASGNVSSVTDNGVGLYAVNFTTAMQDVNYAAIANYNQLNTAVADANDGNASCGNYLTTSVRLAVMNGNADLLDAACISVSIFR